MSHAIAGLVTISFQQIACCVYHPGCVRVRACMCMRACACACVCACELVKGKEAKRVLSRQQSK